MRRLSSFAWRSLLARRTRSSLTVIGIGLGVGVLFASLATNDGIERSIDRTVRDLVGRSDLRVAAFVETGLSDATVQTIRATPGVAVAAPQIQRRTFLAPAPGNGPAIQPPVTVLAIDPAAEGSVHDLGVSAALLATSGPGALISERLAGADALKVGDSITIQGLAAPQDSIVKVVGVLPGDGPIIGTFGRTVIISIDEARAIFGPIGISRVDLRIDPAYTVDGVSSALQARLTTEPYVLSNPADLAASLRASTADFQGTTALLAAIALFVGAFLIFNTLSMTVAERVREVGLLRAAGTTRRQVNGLILLQAAILGAAGSILGIVLGLGLAAVMVQYVRGVASIPFDGLSVPVSGIVLSLVIGLTVTMAAALEPAVRAGRVSPVEALRSVPQQAVGGRAQLRWLIVVFGVVAFAGIALWPHGSGAGAPVRALVVYAILLVAAALSPVVLAPLGRIAGIPFGLVLRTEERLARGALVRDRSRTALTVGALTVGLAMIVAVGGVALNARRAATAWLADVVPGDEIVTPVVPAAIDESGPGPTLAAVAGVARVTPVATFDVAFQGTRLDAAAISGADLLADGRLIFVAGDRRSALTGLDAGGTVILPRSLADRLGLRLGDAMSFTVAGGRATLAVRGIVDRTLPGSAGETVLIGWSDATSRFGVQGADFFAVRFEPGVGAATRPALEEAARTLGLDPNPLERVQGAVADALGQVFSLFDALAAVAVLVAGLGIVNTLTMNVFERVREIGVLRAIGMTRRQVWRMVVVEAGVLGIVGVVLGSITGLAAGAAMVVLAGGGALAGSLEIPWATIGLAAAFGVAVAMLAAYYPARLASGLSIVRAVQFE